MRIVFLGNDAWSVPPLHALAHDPATDVALVITNPPRPAGRGARLSPTAVASAATEIGLPLLETESVATGAGWAALAGAAPEVVVVVAYGSLLTPAVLASAPHGALNLHFSILPRWRGASPVQRAIMAGDRLTGVSVMQMDAGLDTGPVLAWLETPIEDTEDAGALGERLAGLGGALLVATLHEVASGTAVAAPQDPTAVTLAPKITSAERTIDWSDDAASIERRVRSLAPAPGASTRFRGEPLKVLAATVGTEHAPGEDGPSAVPGAPGTIAWTDGRSLPTVATGRGLLALLEVAPAGRRRIAAVEWARGARFAPGERLG